MLTNPHLPDSPIIFVNDAFLQLTRYCHSEILGHNCRFLHGPETDDAVRNQVRTAIEEARPVSVKMLNYRKDGSQGRCRVVVTNKHSPPRTVQDRLAELNDLARRLPLGNRFSTRSNRVVKSSNASCDTVMLEATMAQPVTLIPA